MPYVYLLQSLKDGKQYIGSTLDLKERLLKHNRGYVVSTRNRRPFELICYQKFDSISEAAIFEKKYKRSHGALNRAIKAGKFEIVKNGV